MRLFLLTSALFAAAAWADGPSYTIATTAGSDWVGDGGSATDAILLQAEGIAADVYGNLYISDAENHRVRKVSAAGAISTVAGTGVAGFSGDGGPAAAAQLNAPYGLALDASGNLYIADLGNARVRRIAADGTIATIAGGGTAPAGGVNDGSAATSVSLIAPRNLALDGTGSVYISDFSGHRVYRLNPDGSLTTIAGTGVQGFSADGTAAPLAQLAYPAGLAVRLGVLYIADSQNHVIRKVVNGAISTVARAITPTAVVFDGLGSMYIADPSAGQIIQMPAMGPPVVLTLQAGDLAFDGQGYLYAAGGSVAFQVSFIGPSAVVAGGGNLAHGDGGPAASARLNHPSGVASDSLGNFYIADRDNHRIRQVSVDGTIATIAGTGVAGDSGDGAAATLAQLNSPSAVSVDAAGNLYIVDTGNQRVRKVTPAGVILPVAGNGLVSPTSAVADPNGNVYIADSANGTISKVASDGGTSILATNLQRPGGMALDAAGNLYFAEASGPSVRRLDPSGNLTSLGGSVWNVPRGVAVDQAGDVFVADAGLQQIFEIDSAGHAVAIAGNGAFGFTGDGGPALSAALAFPYDAAVGPGGTLYIADLLNNRIRLLTPTSVSAPVVASLLTVTAVNAASLAPGPLAPGMLVALGGTGLTEATAANAQVVFNSPSNAYSAPILSVTNAGVIVQAPAQIAGLQNVQIQILDSGNALAQVQAAVAASAPALFADASGQASAENTDGSLNTASNPVSRGGVIVLYGTGQGVSGLPVTVSIGLYPAEVRYAGPVAGYPGLWQINAVVPAGYLAAGNVNVTVTVGQASTQPGITIAVD